MTVNAGAFTKLQLLVPGETAAPGTATGKTGTPTAQTAGTAVQRHGQCRGRELERGQQRTDTVGITSSDANATLAGQCGAGRRHPRPSVSRSRRRAVARVTATDITDGTKTANTSPAIDGERGRVHEAPVPDAGRDRGAGHSDGQDRHADRQTAGTAFNVTVNAVDANWNVSAATDTVAITSSDANAALPANAALVAGTQTFSVTLKTAGSRTVTATDITDGAKTANTSPAITVNAGAFAKLQVLVPGETAAPGSATGKTGTPTAQTAGTPFNVTVNAVDANWNVVSSRRHGRHHVQRRRTPRCRPTRALVAGTQDIQRDAQDGRQPRRSRRPTSPTARRRRTPARRSRSMPARSRSCSSWCRARPRARARRPARPGRRPPTRPARRST